MPEAELACPPSPDPSTHSPCHPLASLYEPLTSPLCGVKFNFRYPDWPRGGSVDAAGGSVSGSGDALGLLGSSGLWVCARRRDGGVG